MAMFEDALMESANKITTRSKYWSVLTLFMNCAALLALIVWPLLHPEALPTQAMASLLVAPAPPPPPPPPMPPSKLQARSEIVDSELQAPSRIPRQIKRVTESDLPQPSMDGVIGMESQANGTPGSAMSELFSGITTGRAAVIGARPQKVIISSGVMAGNLLDKVPPQYPAIAKAARIQGTVVLQATISKAGTIENLRVVNGPPMLQQAAIDAVRSWRYKPFLLNGEPVEVETTVNVVFNLGG
jgi:protein TonB